MPPGVAVHRAPATAADAAVLALLDDRERARLARLRRPADRARFATGRRLARTALAPLLGVAPAAVPLRVSPAGRPEVGGSELDLSIAHAGPHVLVAVADGGRRVGVDVEGRDGTPVPDDGLLDVVCAPAERARLRALPPDARRDAFLALWTRKEAVLKADGRGLGIDPATVEVSATGPPRLLVGPAGGADAARVTLVELPAAPGYRAALAVLG